MILLIFIQDVYYIYENGFYIENFVIILYKYLIEYMCIWSVFLYFVSSYIL